MTSGIDKQKKKEVISEINPTEKKCDCCKRYYTALEVSPVHMECLDNHFCSIVNGLEINSICRPCAIILRNVYNGGIERIREEAKYFEMPNKLGFDRGSVKDCLTALMEWHNELISSNTGV